MGVEHRLNDTAREITEVLGKEPVNNATFRATNSTRIGKGVNYVRLAEICKWVNN
jgi:hypothetical protein